MKKYSLLLFLICLVSQINAQKIYEDALTAASYAYSHSKKAYDSNNIYHTQDYADKAAEALQTVEDLADQCGCTDANGTAYEAKSDMESALAEDTYERSRFYAKRAKELGSQLLEQLTICQADANNGYADDVADSEETEIAETSKAVIDKQKELEEKKRQLALEQEKLEQEIAAQQKKKELYEAKRAQELKAKELIKSKAEQALKKLASALQELNIAINDDPSTFESSINNYSLSEDELENESIKETKSFYINRAKELTTSAIQQFAGHNNNIDN